MLQGRKYESRGGEGLETVWAADRELDQDACLPTRCWASGWRICFTKGGLNEAKSLRGFTIRRSCGGMKVTQCRAGWTGEYSYHQHVVWCFILTDRERKLRMKLLQSLAIGFAFFRQSTPIGTCRASSSGPGRYSSVAAATKE